MLEGGGADPRTAWSGGLAVAAEDQASRAPRPVRVAVLAEQQQVSRLVVAASWVGGGWPSADGAGDPHRSRGRLASDRPGHRVVGGDVNRWLRRRGVVGGAGVVAGAGRPGAGPSGSGGGGAAGGLVGLVGLAVLAAGEGGAAAAAAGPGVVRAGVDVGAASAEAAGWGGGAGGGGRALGS